MYYQTRRMISYLDPRLIPSYSSDSVEDVAQRLKDVGITHIQQPSYFMPPTYRTTLGSLLADPDHTRLVLDENLYQLYELTGSEKTVKTTIDLAGPDTQWERAHSIPILQSSQWHVEARPHPHTVGTPSVTQLPLGIFQRDFSTVLKSNHRAQLSKSAEYRFNLDISGAGYVKVSVRFCSSELQLGEIVLERPNTRTNLQRRFISPIETDAFELRIEHLGTSHLVVHNASLDSLASLEN
ncbi:MAG: hypothetical protein EWM45_18260 [Rhodopseudomonas palustris]|nr:MAG: hypothetical protein EWM45_18260 [Rhodopseudomonas palustris]